VLASLECRTIGLFRKLRDKDARIGNLEDTVDALSGRIESEIARGEKLSTQNGSMKDLLDKQATVRPREAPPSALGKYCARTCAEGFPSLRVPGHGAAV
jgi:hypothetical protein